jgi:protein CpxP
MVPAPSTITVTTWARSPYRKEHEMLKTDSRVGSTDAVSALQKRPRGIKRLVAAVLIAGSATVALSAWSHEPHMGGPRGPGMMGPGMGVPGIGGPGLFMGPGALNPEHMNRMIDRMLDGLNATDAQRTQIKEIARVAAVDLKAQHDRDDGKALRDKSLQLFTAPTIDAAAIDSVRQQMEGLRDQSNKRVMQAMIDISRVLTPEQRMKAGAVARFQSDRMQDEMKRMHDRPDGERHGEHGHRGGPDAAPEAPPAR